MLAVKNSADFSPLWSQVLALARGSITLSNPNPRVGCVITSSDGQVKGHGFTQQAGSAHAEVMALRDVATRGHCAAGSTVWVTLEPCSHHGRTPPCCDALIEAKVALVMVATSDPNPLVAGRGLSRLRAAGITVKLMPSDSEAARASRELNIGFFSRMVRGTPWVRMKMASSLDGTTALDNGASQWITGEPARADGHAWRARACAVLTGIGTVLEDDPVLDVRLVETPRQPHLVLVDSRLQTPPSARLFQAPAHGLTRQIWIYHAERNAEKEASLQVLGAQLIHMPDANNKVDLSAMLRDLGRREVNELHVEAGHKLNGSFLRTGLVDELLLYMAPKLLGQGAGLSNLGPLQQLQEGTRLRFESVERIGEDLRILSRVQGHDAFLHPTCS